MWLLYMQKDSCLKILVYIMLFKLIQFHVIIKAVTCAPLSTPPMAQLLNVSCGSTYASTCVFGCQSGYESTYPIVTRTCLQNGEWSGNPINCTGTNALVRLVCCHTKKKMGIVDYFGSATFHV